MAFTVPNTADAAFPAQAGLDSRDLDIITAATALTGVVSGCAVTAQGSPDMTVAVAAGVVRIAGRRVVVTSGNVTIAAAHASNPRHDLITVDTSGTKAVVAGTAAAITSSTEPVFPTIPAGRVVLAAVYVPGADTAINTNQITDKRVTIEDPMVENVLWYGAVPDGTTNNAPFIQAAIDASIPGSTIYFPSHVAGDYGISSYVVYKGGRRYTSDGHGYSGDGAVIYVLSGSNIANPDNGANPVGMFVPDGWNTQATTSSDPVIIENLHFYGNRDNNTGICSGIILANFWSVIRGCYIEEMQGDGIHLTDKTRNETTITGTSSENRIFDCKINECDGMGFRVRAAANFAANLDGFLINNYISGCTGHGAELAVSAGWQVQNNHLYALLSDAVRIGRAYATAVHYNYIEDFGGTNANGVTYCGISADISTGRGSTIQGNKIFGEAPNTNPSSYRYINVNTSSTSETECHIVVKDNEIRGNNRATETAVYVDTQGGTAKFESALLEPNDIHNIGGVLLFIGTGGGGVIPWYTKPTRRLMTGGPAGSTNVNTWVIPTGISPGIPVRLGVSYRIQCLLLTTATVTTAGVKVRLTGPTMTDISYYATSKQTATVAVPFHATAISTALSWTDSMGTTATSTFLEGTFKPSAAGNIAIEVATEQNTSAQTIISGGYMVVEELLT